MRAVSITEAKNKLSALIKEVQGGDDVLILDRGVPVARLISAASENPDELDGRRKRLIRAGILRPPRRRRRADSILDEPPPELDDDVDLVSILIEERRSGW